MAASGRGPQPARPGLAWRPGTRPPVTRKPLGGLDATSINHSRIIGAFLVHPGDASLSTLDDSVRLRNSARRSLRHFRVLA